jgi:hypothetical protein
MSHLFQHFLILIFNFYLFFLFGLWGWLNYPLAKPPIFLNFFFFALWPLGVAEPPPWAMWVVQPPQTGSKGGLTTPSFVFVFFVFSFFKAFNMPLMWRLTWHMGQMSSF